MFILRSVLFSTEQGNSATFCVCFDLEILVLGALFLQVGCLRWLAGLCVRRGMAPVYVL